MRPWPPRTSAPAGVTAWIAPIPWPDPQIWLHALGLDEPPSAALPKSIAEASAAPSASGSSPAARIEGLR